MTVLHATGETEDLGGRRRRLIQHVRRIAYNDNGTLRRIVSNWIDSGIPERPHIVTAAPLMVSVAPDGMRRIHPTREVDRYIELGAPYVKVGGVWTKTNLGTPTRTGNLLQWTKPQANLYVRMLGHGIKFGLLFKGGWVPEDNLIAWPVGMSGLNRSGLRILRDGVQVATLRKPHVEDMDNTDDLRPVATQFVQMAGQWYALMTLPSLAGMSKPLLDPTLTLQPDAAAGSDTHVYEGQGTGNYGVNTTFNSGTSGTTETNRGFVSFDISAIPGGATASSATLTLYCESEAAAADENVGAHRALTQWYEGDDTGSLPSGDGSTWNLRNHSGSVAWAGGAGGGSGSDYAASAVATVAITAASAAYNFNVLTDAQLFIDGTSNYGWWLINTDEVNASTVKRFTSSDGGTAANRPKLVIEYTAGVPALAMHHYRTRRT